jgi:hypothetical protein
VGGDWVCAQDRSLITGLCYTDDCAGSPGLCVQSCGDLVATLEVCLAGSFQCETGIAQITCPDAATDGGAAADGGARDGGGYDSGGGQNPAIPDGGILDGGNG